ncbi:E3 ubiquitin-protein ligase ARIH2 [Myotis davidii]|uniref:E3 ubiquitin-protein ligase ARIH2 n=1 Tax=Myotis davidii TaxID=225400 RepID=L5LG92_MYODS|nr:E3 ubiquitin-protein ligase ARIH2 [Myotis davidii]
MSVDMNSQGSDSNEEDYDPNCEEEEEDEDPGDIEDYYVGVASDVEQQGADAFDPEEYQFTCLTYKESEGALNEHMTSLASVLKKALLTSRDPQQCSEQGCCEPLENGFISASSSLSAFLALLPPPQISWPPPFLRINLPQKSCDGLFCVPCGLEDLGVRLGCGGALDVP